MNENKYYILDLGLDAVTSTLLRNNFTYPWADRGITYLGITLTKSTKGLFAANYVEAKQMLLREKTKLSKHEFCWSGRLAAFKMQVQPKLLYIFRTLPLLLSHAYIHSLQSIISHYVWQGKKPRSNHVKLIKHRSAGGMGYIDLIDYYLATLLSQLKDWLSDEPTTLWGNIENNLTPGKNLKDWLFSTLSGQSYLNHYSPAIRASIKAWKTLHDIKWSHLPTKTIRIPLTVFPLLSPDLKVPTWLSAQATHIATLRPKILDKPFSQMQNEYDAPAKDYFTYYRLQKCLAAHPSLEKALPIKMWNFLFTDNTRSKGTSLFYST